MVKRNYYVLPFILIIFALLIFDNVAYGDALTLPASLEEIGEMAFYGDTSLDEVYIPDGTVFIGPQAFAHSGIKKIHIPLSVTDIASDAFEQTDVVIFSSAISEARKYADRYEISWKNEGDIPLTEKCFPDNNFRNWITSNYDSDQNGLLNSEEIQAVQYMNCSSRGFTLLEGIGFFSNLKYLYCSNNGLTELNLSGCSELKEIYCNNNQLISLDVSGCPILRYIDCSVNQLPAIDLSNNTALISLLCNGNQLQSLHISGVSTLKELYCNENSLTSLDLSGASSLQTLSCENCQLSDLNVSNCTKLNQLFISDNPLEILNVSGCTSLTKLECAEMQLTTLNVTGCSSLTNLNCDHNQLTSIDISGCSALTILSCGYNRLTILDVSSCSSLTVLKCLNNQLTSLDVTNCSMLKELDCFKNLLESLDVSGCTALTELKCEANQLTTLDVSDCHALTILFCLRNQLTCLDVSECSDLEVIACFDNQLTSLDVSNFSALTELNCNNNHITSLDVSGCSALTGLYCYNNQLTSLDVSDCSNLKKLNCDYNQLTKLDVSGCSALSELSCDSNQLTTLNVSGCSNLISLSCNNNQLTTLAIQSCPDCNVTCDGSVEIIRSGYTISNISTDKSQYTFGDTLTIYFTINGGEVYFPRMFVAPSGGSLSSSVSTSAISPLDSTTGRFQATSKIGNIYSPGTWSIERIVFNITSIRSNGTFSFHNTAFGNGTNSDSRKYVDMSGSEFTIIGEPEYLDYNISNISTDKSQYSYGDTLTINFDISGGEVNYAVLYVEQPGGRFFLHAYPLENTTGSFQATETIETIMEFYNSGSWSVSKIIIYSTDNNELTFVNTAFEEGTDTGLVKYVDLSAADFIIE